MVPNGDLFTRSPAAAVRVTDRIDRFTPTGILLESGASSRPTSWSLPRAEHHAARWVRAAADEAPVELSETTVYQS